MTKSNMPTASEAGRAGLGRSARLSRCAPLLIAIFVLLGVLAAGPAFASAALPPYEGDMSFPTIHGPSAPEEYSWEVQLGPEQTLEQVDEQHAEVYYAYEHHPAFGITAEAAHDANGASVPTSLIVSEGNIITLIVHHRAGNPAAGGAPFDYPVLAGEGWEGGFITEIVKGPYDETELREERERIERAKQQALEREWEAAQARKASKGCHVPRLKGRSLKASKQRLREANCRIGDVSKLKGASAKAAMVVKQNPKPGGVLASGAAVDVKLGPDSP